MIVFTKEIVNKYIWDSMINSIIYYNSICINNIIKFNNHICN